MDGLSSVTVRQHAKEHWIMVASTRQAVRKMGVAYHGQNDIIIYLKLMSN